jgi:hypothetical protein
MVEYTITITDNYEEPSVSMTKEQYINFVMNRAAESYRRQYGTETSDAGIQAACDVYNQSLPAAQEVPQIEEILEEENLNIEEEFEEVPEEFGTENELIEENDIENQELEEEFEIEELPEEDEQEG